MCLKIYNLLKVHKCTTLTIRKTNENKFLTILCNRITWQTTPLSATTATTPTKTKLEVAHNKSFKFVWFYSVISVYTYI